MCRIKKVTNKIMEPKNRKNEVATSKKRKNRVVMRAKILAIVAKMGDFNSFIILLFFVSKVSLVCWILLLRPWDGNIDYMLL